MKQVVSKMFGWFLAVFAVLVMVGGSVNAADAPPNKVHVVYYYGIGCGFCEKLEPWLLEFERQHSDFVDIERVEIFQNKENAKKFNGIMGLYGVKPEDRGTPTAVINNRVLIGYDFIMKELEGEFQKALARQKNDPNTQTQQNPPAAETQEDFSLSAVFLAAAADSVNPCAMMVLIILLASLFAYQKDDIVRVVSTVSSFVFAVFVTYFLLGLGLVNFITSTKAAKEVAFIVGCIAIILGVINMYDALFSKTGSRVSVPDAWKNKLTSIVSGATSPLGAFAAGALVTMFELPCTGGPYLFGISLMAMRESLFERIGLLFLYNLIFVSPLVALAFLCIRGKVALEQAESFRSRNIRLFNGITGVILFAGGCWLLFFR